MGDLIIVCKGCGEDFTFSDGEQKFFKSKGFSSPIRCAPCRQKRKREKEQQAEPTEKDERLA